MAQLRVRCGHECTQMHPADVDDALPKWRTFAHRKVLLTNDGKVIE